MLKNWLKVFIHNIKKNKLFTLLNTLGLSIGIAGIIFAILYWNDENSYEKWNPELENVYQVISSFKGPDFNGEFGSVPMAFQAHLKEMENVKYSFTKTYYQSGSIKTENKEQFNNKIYSASFDFFKLYPFTFLKGNSNTCLIKNNSVVITSKVAKFFFADANPMGKTIKYKNKVYTITGVFKVPGKSACQPEIITNDIQEKVVLNSNNWMTFTNQLWLKINGKNNVKKVNEKLNQLTRIHRTQQNAKNKGITLKEYEKKHGKILFRLSSLKNSRLKEKVNNLPGGKGDYQFLLIMLVLSFLILILSIFNYINLATANALKRAKEVGVRKIIGATKKNIILQFIFETTLTTTLAILIALSIVELGLPYYNNFLDKNLTAQSTTFIYQLILILITVVLVAGVFPAIYVSNFEALKALKGNFDSTKGGMWLRNSMLILQFAIAAFFISGSYVVYQQINHLVDKNLGLNPEQIIELLFDDGQGDRVETLSKYEVIKNELKKIKGVEEVTGTYGDSFAGSILTYGLSYKDKIIQSMIIPNDFNFIKTFDIKLSKGRLLQPKFASDSINNIIINETALTMMQEKKPLGKRLKLDDNNRFKIVGIIKDFDLYNPSKKRKPVVLINMKAFDWSSNVSTKVYVKISTKNIEKTITGIEKLWTSKVDKKNIFEYKFVDKLYENSYKTYTNQRNLFGVLNIFVIIIALFGLFSLASFTIERSMKSIAIRKILGAETKTLLIQLSKQYILFCVLGFIIAILPVVYTLNKWLENFSYRIDISPLPFLIGFIALLSLTLIIVLGKAYQATKVDVLKYLKNE